MNRLFLFLFLSLAAAVLPARAEGPDDQYIQIYGLIQDADKLSVLGQAAAAVSKFNEAQIALQHFQRAYPNWNPNVVNFRLNYIASKISGGGATDAAIASTPKPTPVAPATTAPVAPPPAVPSEHERQLAGLQEDLRRSQADKSALEAKLKEALAAQPAALDPRELAQAQQQIRELMKENELLKTSIPTEKAGPGPAPDSKNVEEIRRALAEANRKLDDQTSRADALASEKKILQRRLNTLTAAPEADAARKLAAAEVRIAALESDAAAWRQEKIALENRAQTLTAQAPTSEVVGLATNPPPSHPTDLARLKRLENERDELSRKLAAATKELQGRKGRAGTARIEALDSQLAGLRARVEIFEARAVPYTAEELALLDKPAPQLAAQPPNAGKKPISTLPRGTAGFVASAQRHFTAKEFDQAEADYLEILRRDENNSSTLANLAAIQLERGNLDDAEKNVKKALAAAPTDAYSLSLLGFVKFRQQKYDEALDALSRAAQSNPQSAEIQNYLGLTLSHKGLRGPAETALRKAITLDPNYASAHNNLAVIYLTHQPPSLELARWHYEKARAAGHPRNEELEKQLNEKIGGP